MSRHLLLQVTGIKRGQSAICRHRQENARPRFTRDNRVSQPADSGNGRCDVPSRSQSHQTLQALFYVKHICKLSVSTRKRIINYDHACPPRRTHATSSKQNDVTRAYLCQRSRQTDVYHQTRKLYSQTFSNLSWMRRKSARSAEVQTSRCS